VVYPSFFRQPPTTELYPLPLHAPLPPCIRERTEALATQALGWRTGAEIRASRARAVERIQFTELDRALLRRAGPDRILPAGALVAERSGQKEYRDQERRRLAFLERLSLARPIGRDAWQLSPA